MAGILLYAVQVLWRSGTTQFPVTHLGDDPSERRWLMDKKQITYSIGVIIILPILLNGCSFSSGNEESTITSSSTFEQTVEIPEPSFTHILPLPTPSFTRASTPYPLEGKISFLFRQTAIYTIDLPIGKPIEILDNQSLTNDLIAVPNNRLYFLLGGVSDHQQLYSLNTDGRELTRITFDIYDDNILAVNSNGDRAAFVQLPRFGGDTQFLSILDLHPGSQISTIYTSKGFPIDDLSWSNDGKKLAFIKMDPAFNYNYGELYIIDADGSNLTEIGLKLPILLDLPTWSPDDSQIAVSAKDETGVNIYIVDIRKNTSIRLTNTKTPALHPLWSPRGDKLLFVQGLNYYIIDPDGLNQMVLTDQASDPEFSFREAAWSPDGRYVAVVRSGSLYIVSAAGGKPHLVAIQSPINDISWIKSSP